MDEVVALLALPTSTISAVAIGFLAYRTAYTGKDAAHSGVDVVLTSAVFALVFRVIERALGAPGIPFAVTLGLAALATLCAAAVWRRWGERHVFQLLRLSGVSISDRSVTAWDRLRVEPLLRPKQVVVQRKDGTALMCDRLSAYADQPTGALIFGADGSVALYVTDASAPGSAEWEPQEVTGPDDWGSLMTYIPADEIAQISVRY